MSIGVINPTGGGGAGFPIASGATSAVQSGGTLLVSSGGAFTINAGGSVTNSGAETIASGGSITIASGGTETVASGGTLSVSSGGQLVVAGGAVISQTTVNTLNAAMGNPSILPGPVTGRWYAGPAIEPGSGNLVSVTSGQIHATLFYNPAPMSWTKIGTYNISSSGIGNNLKWAIYQAAAASTGSGGSPTSTALIATTTATSMGAASAGVSATISTGILPQGWHWLCVMADAGVALGGGGQPAGILDEQVYGYNAIGNTTTKIIGFTATNASSFASGFQPTFPTATAISNTTSVACVQMSP